MGQRHCPKCHRELKEYENGHCYNCDGNVGVYYRETNRKTRTTGGKLIAAPYTNNRSFPVKRIFRKSYRRPAFKITYTRKHRQPKHKQTTAKQPSLIRNFKKFLGEFYGEKVSCGKILHQNGYSKKKIDELGKNKTWVKHYYEMITVQLFFGLCESYPEYSVQALFVNYKIVGELLQVINPIPNKTIYKLMKTPIDPKIMWYLKGEEGKELLEGIIVNSAESV